MPDISRLGDRKMKNLLMILKRVFLPVRVFGASKWRNRFFTFAVNLIVYFLLLRLFLWIAGIDPIQKFYIGPMSQRVELQIAENQIRQQRIQRELQMRDGQMIYSDDLKALLDEFSDLQRQEARLRSKLATLTSERDAHNFKVFPLQEAEAGIVNRVIYAGETPLASTCAASLTGLMQITIPACSFTTTGESRVISPEKVTAEIETWISNGKAARMPNGRVRVWLQKRDGTVHEKSRTATLLSDAVLNIPTPLVNTLHRAALGVTSGVAFIMVQSSTNGGRSWSPAPPAGWRLVHILIFPFLVPAGDTDLTDNTIEVFGVLPGFPPGTEPEDFKIQIGN